MPSRWPSVLRRTILLMGLALPWALLAPLPAMGFSALIAGTAFSQRRRLGRMLGKIEATEPLRLSAGPEGLQLAIGPALPVPLHDAWRIGPVDVLYPAAGAPQLLWPDSLLPADRARMRALMTLHPCSSR